MLLHAFSHRFREAIVNYKTSITKFGCKAPHGGDDEVSSLNMPAAGCNFGMRLDHQDAMCFRLRIAECTDLSIQLVSKDPDCALVHHLMIFNSWQYANSVPSMSRESQTKNGFAPRICITCGKPIEWRKKWARDWEKVLYCSQRCSGRVKR